jgi:glycine hydroxymethyltransferase
MAALDQADPALDTRTPFDPSGIRRGTAPITSRGMGPAEMKLVADWMDRVIRSPAPGLSR